MINLVTRKYTQHTWAMLALVGLFTLFLGAGAQASTSETKRLTHRQVKTLIATAKTPEDHLLLARYFTSEADRLEAESMQHQQLAEARRYSAISTLAAVKNPMGPQTAAHCEYFAKSTGEAAKSARQLAAAHEQMAKDAAASAK